MPRLSCEQAKQMLQSICKYLDVYKIELAYYADHGDQNLGVRILKLEVRIKQMAKELREGLGVSFDKAREILGKDFLGPEAIKKAFSFELLEKDIPPIPFSVEDLERAKELGQFLILRTDIAPDGKPLTMQKMEQLSKEPAFQNDWFKQEDFYTKDKPKTGWVLVSKEVIPNSISKNYLQQTETIIDYLENHVFRGMEYPEGYQEAINEYHAKSDEIKKIIGSDWKEAAKRLSELQITKLTRQSAADVMHDLMVYKQNNNERLLENVYTWTSARRSDGGLVFVGNFKFDGLNVTPGNTGSAGVNLGACFARNQ